MSSTRHRPLGGARLRPAGPRRRASPIARARSTTSPTARSRVITLNRPHADNAITTEMGARLTEIVETIAVRTAVRVVILTGAGERAFSVGSDLRQRKNMTKEDWLRQRQDFDRTLYTVRQLRKPIFAAVNGIAYGGGCELAQSTDFIIASEQRHLRPARGDARPRRRRRLAGAAAAPAAPRQGAADAHDRRPDHRAGGAPARHGQRAPRPRRADGRGAADRGEDREQLADGGARGRRRADGGSSRRTSSRMAVRRSTCRGRRRAILGTQALHRRFVVRLGRRRRCPPGAGDSAPIPAARSAARRLVRHGRHQGDLWPGLASRRVSAVMDAGPHRPADPQRGGRGDHAAGVRRTRPARSRQRRCSRARLSRRSGEGRFRSAHRHPARLLRHGIGYDSRGGGGARPHGGAIARGGCDGRRTSNCPTTRCSPRSDA